VGYLQLLLHWVVEDDFGILRFFGGEFWNVGVGGDAAFAHVCNAGAGVGESRGISGSGTT